MMADIEKVMSWLEGLSQDDWREFHSDSEVSNIAKDALELLKEHPKIVRCKDCIYYHTSCCQCSWANDVEHDDYFCADGTRRDDDG